MSTVEEGSAAVPNSHSIVTGMTCGDLGTAIWLLDDHD